MALARPVRRLTFRLVHARDAAEPFYFLLLEILTCTPKGVLVQLLLMIGSSNTE